ncbi:hypothetical protein [Paracoccus sp. MC1862]|uniref:hypothetical protein n=1 Tax=Paracoccus sp. MC1862 TaxID=2760307 RepID=UPI0016015054|nr:hypothetical protein [Paracoccus sp. MC1862]MBB1499423.1 hypothetical protein [Paracoccus sp. MC1862]QQO45380.1 hypothetical protein JGR78_03195 [Paracoccus sp. MC1862]
MAYFGEKFTGLAHYWKAYGGAKEIIRSPYFHIALIISVILHPLWRVEGDAVPAWVEFAKSVVPSMVAFSLGALAIIFTVNSGQFFDLIRKERSGYSYFMKLMASFSHFIVLQVSSIFGAMIVMAYRTNLLSFIFFSIFCYALLSAIAAVGTLMGLAFIRGKNG